MKVSIYRYRGGLECFRVKKRIEVFKNGEDVLEVLNGA
jgi:hypothetical protein